MKPLDECLYYLVREMGNLGAEAKPIYFESALEHVRRDGLAGMTGLEVRALVYAARRRGRLAELDEAVEGCYASCYKCEGG